jgi:serine/threonine protein kinase
MTHAESHISAEDVVVGQGAYGTVYKAKRPSLRAIKVIPYTHTIPAEAIREIATLKRLDGCDGCVRLLDIWIGSNTIELNLELCPNGSLQERLDAGASASFPKRLLWAGQLLDGLIGVHDKNMVHRDVKPENILLTATDDIKLVDFGLSRNGPDGAPLTPRVCTIYYRPPELLAHYLSHGGDGRAAMVYGPEVDCWSAGCVLRELLTGRGPEFRPTDVAVDPLVSSAQQLEAIIT